MAIDIYLVIFLYIYYYYFFKYHPEDVVKWLLIYLLIYHPKNVELALSMENETDISRKLMCIYHPSSYSYGYTIPIIFVWTQLTEPGEKK